MSESDPKESIQTDSGERSQSDQEGTTSELGETTHSDVGGSTSSNSGSGSISDWALVDEDGHLQDYDTESTSSSVEVMEEEDDEADPITPVAGNSPQGNIVSPQYVLRLSSHEVSDTDDEVPTTSVSDSQSFDVLSSDLLSSTTSQESGKTTSLDTTPQPDALAVQKSGGATMPVSPEELESLTRALDDVKNNLLQSQSIDSSLSSFEMFGDGANEANKLVPVEKDDIEAMKKSKAGNFTDDMHLMTQVKSLEMDLDQPETIGPLALAPESETARTVAVMPEPAEEGVLHVQQQMEDVYQRIVENVRVLRHDGIPWYIGTYTLLMSVIVCTACCLFYRLALDQKVQEIQTQCPQDAGTAYSELMEARKDIDEVRQANHDLMNRILESQESLKISDQEKSKLQDELYLLEDSLKDVLKELAKSNKEKQEMKDEIDRKQRDDDDLDLFEEENGEDEEILSEDQYGRRNSRRDSNQFGNGGNSQSDNEYEDQSTETGNGKNRQNKRNKNNNDENGKKEKEKRKRRKDSKNRRVEEEEEEEESYNGGRGSEGSGESDSQWVDNIFQLMNKTKNQIQDTWKEVRNISDNLWKEHSPTLEKLQRKFVKRFEHISNRFQEKVWKKTRKWFGRKRKSGDRDEDDEESRTTKDSTTRTKRRPHYEKENIKIRPKKDHDDDDDDDDDNWSFKFSENTGTKTMCDSRLIELSRKIKVLNVKKFESMSERQRWDLTIMVKSVLRALVHDQQVKEDDIQSEWVRCQSDWWGGGDKQKVGDGCLEYLSCWQVKWAKGDVKNCRKIKNEIGNVLDNRCPVGPFYDEDDDQSIMDKEPYRDRSHLFTANEDDGYNSYGEYDRDESLWG